MTEERRRGPAEAPNLGEPATPRPSASVVLLRRGGKHGDRALEVLLLKRSEEAKFMPGVWVFPGGRRRSGGRRGRGRAPGLRGAGAGGGGGHRVAGRRGAGAVLALDHARGRLAALRRLVLPRARPGAHAARARRGRDDRGGLVRAAGGARSPARRRARSSPSRRSSSSNRCSPTALPRKRSRPIAAGRSSRSCPRSSAPRTSTASSYPATPTTRRPNPPSRGPARR